MPLQGALVSGLQGALVSGLQGALVSGLQGALVSGDAAVAGWRQGLPLP